MAAQLPVSGLAELLRYHAWAMKALIDHAATVPPAELHIPRPDSVGSIYSTFEHVLGAEGWSLRRLVPAEDIPRLPSDRSLEGLHSIATAHASLWLRIATDPALLAAALPALDTFPAIRDAGLMLTLQAIHHGEVHRTELRAQFSTIGHPIPGRDMTDVWAFWEATGRLGGPLPAAQ
jgi:uncharacterized damage-inducible protein DinB